jgi:hypothetical protein
MQDTMQFPRQKRTIMVIVSTQTLPPDPDPYAMHTLIRQILETGRFFGEIQQLTLVGTDFIQAPVIRQTAAQPP